MVNVTPDTGSIPAPLSLPARVVGVLTSPGATFKAVMAHPRWLGILILTAVIAAVFSALPMTTEGGQQAAIDASVKMIESFGIRMPDEAYAKLQQEAPRMAYTTARNVLIFAPLVGVILSAILFGISKLMSTGATFKQVFSVWLHAGVVGSVGQIFTGSLNYFRESVSSATNLAIMLPMLEEGSFLARLAGMVDLFWIWWLSVLSIGLAVAFKKRTTSVAAVLFAIYAVCALAFAGIMAAVGGA